MNKKLKVYIIAGEPSGDLLGSRLMRAFIKKNGKNVEFKGIGGDTMEVAGLKSLFDISELSIMGLLEIIPSIPRVLYRIRQTVQEIVAYKPDVVITIDSWSFSARVHHILKKKKLGIPQVHYVAPQVWAWKKKRARTMYKYIDCLMTLLPNEPKYFTPYKLQADFVGHPVIESDVIKGDADDFFKKYHISKDKKIITILPGSRKTEVAKLLPIFLEAAQELFDQDNSLCFVLPTVKTVATQVKAMTWQYHLPLLVVETEQDRYNAFKASKCAIAASGTVALELAISGVPHVIAYKVSKLTAMIVRKFINIEFVNLSNILLGREIIPELIQERCVASNLKKYTLDLLNKGDLYETQIEGFSKIKSVLGLGEQTPSENAVDIVLALLNKTE